MHVYAHTHMHVYAHICALVHAHAHTHTHTHTHMVLPGGSVIKNPPANAKEQVQSLGWEDPLEKELATHSSIFAWEIPWRRSLAGYSPWGCEESDMT